MVGTAHHPEDAHWNAPKNVALDDVVQRIHEKNKPEENSKPILVYPAKQLTEPSTLGFYEESGKKLSIFEAIGKIFHYKH